jgi:Flp pilus assembly protein TadD
VEEYGKACALNPRNAAWFGYLAMSLARTGDLAGAVDSSRKALALDPSAGAETYLGSLLFESGQTQDGYEHLRKAVDMAPDLPVGHFRLGLALAKMGQLDEAVEHLQRAVMLVPTSAEYRFNLGFAMGLRGDLAGAVASFQKAVELSQGKNWQPLAALADAYDKAGRSTEAVQAARRALDLALQAHDEQLENSLRAILERYESGVKAQRR